MESGIGERQQLYHLGNVVQKMLCEQGIQSSLSDLPVVPCDLGLAVHAQADGFALRYEISYSLLQEKAYLKNMQVDNKPDVDTAVRKRVVALDQRIKEALKDFVSDHIIHYP